MKLGLGGPKLVVLLDPGSEPAKRPAKPQDHISESVSKKLGACIPGTQIKQTTLFEGQAELGNVVSPRRRSFAAQIVQSPNRLGHHGFTPLLCTAACDAALHEANIGP